MLTPLTTVRPLYDLVRSRVRNVAIQFDPSEGHTGSVLVRWPVVLFPLAVVVLSVRSKTSVVPSVMAGTRLAMMACKSGEFPKPYPYE